MSLSITLPSLPTFQVSVDLVGVIERLHGRVVEYVAAYAPLPREEFRVAIANNGHGLETLIYLPDRWMAPNGLETLIYLPDRWMAPNGLATAARMKLHRSLSEEFFGLCAFRFQFISTWTEVVTPTGSDCHYCGGQNHDNGAPNYRTPKGQVHVWVCGTCRVDRGIPFGT